MENKARARAHARAPDDARPGQRARHAHERRASCVLSHLRAQYHGTGRFTKANGDTYMGECIKGRAHGRGVLAYSTGEKYRGEFAHNQVLLRCPRVARGHRVCVCLDAAPSSHSRARARANAPCWPATRQGGLHLPEQIEVRGPVASGARAPRRAARRLRALSRGDLNGARASIGRACTRDLASSSLQTESDTSATGSARKSTETADTSSTGPRTANRLSLIHI